MAYRLNSRQTILDELPADVRLLLEAQGESHVAVNSSSDLRQSAIGRLLDSMPASEQTGDDAAECRACIDCMIDSLIYMEARTQIEEMEKQQEAMFSALYQRLTANEPNVPPPPLPLSSMYLESSSKRASSGGAYMFSSTAEWAPAVKEKVPGRRRSSFNFNGSMSELICALSRSQLDSIRAERAESLAARTSNAPSQAQVVPSVQKQAKPFRF
jgi:hypothetical protein